MLENGKKMARWWIEPVGLVFGHNTTITGPTHHRLWCYKYPKITVNDLNYPILLWLSFPVHLLKEEADKEFSCKITKKLSYIYLFNKTAYIT